MGNFPTLFEDSNLSGLPVSNPGSGRPWLDGSGAIIVGAAFSLATSDITGLDAALAAKADLVGGLVPSAQLPSYVDDVIEAANFAALPVSGEAGKIYVTLDNSRTYRWSGTAYVELTDATAVWGSVSGTLANQTDLQSALNGKASSTHTHAAADIVSGTIATARLGGGTANASTYLRGDQTWATVTAGAAWGGITGTLSSQADLQAALDAKLALAGGTLTGQLTSNAIVPATHATYNLGSNASRFANGYFSSAVLTGSFSVNGNVLLRANSADTITVRNAVDSAKGHVDAQNGIFGGTLAVTGTATFSGLVSLGAYTFATLPSASANAGKCLRITDRGQKHAYSDGTNWLFVHDNSVVV